MSGKQWRLSRYLAAEWAEESKDVHRGCSDRGGILFFHKMTQVTPVLKPQFSLLYYNEVQSYMAQNPCLIKFLPTSAACIFVLSSPLAVLVPPRVLCTCCFFLLENVLTLLAWLTLSPFRFQCKITYHRDPLSSYCPPPLLYSKLRHT